MRDPGLAHVMAKPALGNLAKLGSFEQRRHPFGAVRLVDAETLAYLHTSGRSADRIALIEAYTQAQGMLRAAASPDPEFTDTLSLDLAEVKPSGTSAMKAIMPIMRRGAVSPTPPM